MTENRSKILEKAKKLKELADRGVGGEQDNAKDMLEKYMAKHNITMDEITGFDSSNSMYANMSDEKFMKIMFNEFLAFGLGYLISKIFKTETPYTNGKAFDELANKYNNAVKDRMNKK